MSEIDRYDEGLNWLDYDEVEAMMFSAIRGKYVLYDDHQAVVDEMQREINGLGKVLNQKEEEILELKEKIEGLEIDVKFYEDLAS